jgi:membrane-associated phospholipid phosphatase
LFSEETATLSLAPAATPRRLRLGRVLAIGAPVVYVAALTLTIVSWGLPVARDQLFLWLGLGMAAFSVPAWRSWGGMLLEWLPFYGLLVAYDFLRGAVAVTPAQAHVNAQLDIDKIIGLGAIPTVWLQQHLWHQGHPHAWDYGIWAVYMTHFFAVWVVAAVLWRVSRPRFRRYVVLTLLVTLGAFLTYWLYPAQPPWLTSEALRIGPVDRIVPEVWGQLGVQTVQSAYENGSLVNTVAAMPSLHAAYPCMLLLFFWPAGWFVRGFLAAYTLAMGFTLVYGGEHYVMDILSGWLLAGAAFALVTLAAPPLARLRARLRARARPAAPPAAAEA